MHLITRLISSPKISVDSHLKCKTGKNEECFFSPQALLVKLGKASKKQVVWGSSIGQR